MLCGGRPSRGFCRIGGTASSVLARMARSWDNDKVYGCNGAIRRIRAKRLGAALSVVALGLAGLVVSAPSAHAVYASGGSGLHLVHRLV
jgi:hypothetical protein